MHEQTQCPFLNRSDSRCSDYFNLGRVRFAFQYCMGDYHACPQYAELLTERQSRRAVASPAMVQVTVNTRLRKPLSGAA